MSGFQGTGKIKILSLLLAACLIMGLMPMTALAAGSDSETDDYAFDADTGTLTVKTNAGTAYSSVTYEYEDTNWRHSSSGIAPAAVTSVIFQNGVTVIGERAFYECSSLASIGFPDTPYAIGHNAFNRNTALTGNLDLGSVTALGEGAFAYCHNLTILLTSASAPTFNAWWSYEVPRVYYPAAWGLPGSRPNLSIFGNAFPTPIETANYSFNVGALTIKTNAGTAYADSNYTSTNWRHSSSGIGSAAVTSVIIRDSVAKIGKYAFFNCAALTSVTFPNTPYAIGDFAFYNTGLSGSLDLGDATSIGQSAFEGCADLTSVTFPNAPYAIGDYAFYETGLSGSLDLGDVTSIGECAFYECYSIASVVFPDTSYVIGNNAFNRNTALTGNLDLGGVTVLGNGAFAYCTNPGLSILLTSASAPTFEEYWALEVPRVYYPAAWGTPDSVQYYDYARAIIDTAAIPGVTAPVRGAAPVSAITETAQYTGTVTWEPAGSTFAPSTVYTATITLTPKTYYTLACVPENFFTVAGATSAANSANSGVITAVFPATAASPGSGGSGGDAPPADTTVYNDSSQSNATILLSGGGLNQSDLLVTQPLTSGGNYNAFLKLADKDDILRVYDISLKSGKTSFGGGAHLTFDLGGEYAGQTFTLVHRKADGSLEYFFATADAKGNVKFGPLYELSPFMLVKGTLLYTPTHEVAGIPKTGDDGFPVWRILLFLSGICASLLLMRRRKGKAGRVP